jgi:hypothetical protein
MMNLDATKLTRSVYTFWTVIADVGGLFGILISFSTTILSVFDHQKSENYLVDQLYSNIDSNVPDANKN